MEPEVSAQQEWWQAVRSIAELVHRQGVPPDDDRQIRAQLAEQGYSEAGICQALDWMDRASLSGNLTDSLAMIQETTTSPRIEHLLEQVSVHPQLLRAVTTCRQRAWLQSDVAERLLEGLRVMDSRDWDRQEIDGFLADVLGVSVPSLAGLSLESLLRRWPRDRYN
jgi:uncharacterized protein Smg (DUF494 family)